MKNVKLFDTPPDARTKNIDWDQPDGVIIQLIDNPGKWALLTTRTNLGYRSTSMFLIRYGSGFTFKTFANKDTNLLEVWASYEGDTE
jgi:hypothetical protein